MKFSIIWASVTPVYVGMIYGLFRMGPQALGSPQAMLGLGIGLLFGGGMALPLAASNLAAASLAAWLTRGQLFWTQFGVFALMSFVFYYQMLQFLDQGLRTMGGLHLDRAHLLWQAGFVAAGLAMALVLMVFNVRPRTAWTG